MKHTNLIRSWSAIALTAVTLNLGCKKVNEDTAQTNEVAAIAGSFGTMTETGQMMESFSLILRNAVSEDADLRRFIKAEALKTFDLDYDVLYAMVKDQVVSNNETFRQKLLKFAKSEQTLKNYEDNLPLLTIYIPELPNFSAKKWNADIDKPAVSTGRSNAEKMVTYYLNDGKEQQKSIDLIPGFPLLVVKNNERVVLTDNASNRVAASASRVGSTGKAYVFTSENFDGITKKESSAAAITGNTTNKAVNSTCSNCSLDTKTSTAFDLWEANGGSINNIWQRDYIYYSISPSSPNGSFDTRYQETITAIKFIKGREAYNKIADQVEDPYAVWDNSNSPRPTAPTATWTEGSFEMNVTVLINSTQGLGSTITKLFPVHPSELFYLHYVHQGDNFYTLNIHPVQCNLNVPIAAWDIKYTGVAWRVILSEADASQSVTNSYTNTSQFATNFGLDFSKIGLKFGVTETAIQQSTYSITSQLADDKLGDGALYFSDPVVTSFDIIPGIAVPSYTFKDVETGWALITIQPKRVF